MMRWIKLLDVAFAGFAVTMLLVWGLLGTSEGLRKRSLLLLTGLGAAFVLYKLTWLVLKYRVGVSRATGLEAKEGSGARTGRHSPASWWSVGIQLVWLLCGAGGAGLLWWWMRLGIKPSW